MTNYTLDHEVPKPFDKSKSASSELSMSLIMDWLITMKQLAALTVILSSTAAASTRQEPKILPRLNSTANVGVTYIPMTDMKRMDPFTNYTEKRQVMVSLYYPAQSDPSELILQQPVEAGIRYDTISYMPPTTAALYDELVIPLGFPKKTFEQLSTLCQQDAPAHNEKRALPLLVFSPGGGAPRFLYSTLSEDLARRGYVVAAVDHPHDALVVEFPDGRTVIGLNKSLTRHETELLVTVRAQDLSFVIDELIRQYPAKINTSDVVAFGHSLGGAAVAEAMLNDTRIKGGINLDGRLFGSMETPNVTLSKPFLQFASEMFSSWPWARWEEEWEHLSGWKLELVLNGAAHSTFCDFPLIAEALNLRDKLGEDGKQLLGELDGMRGLEIMVEYVSAFADFVLLEKNGNLLGSGGNEKFPEVVVKRHI